jgi:ABC-type ATPase involved in cell division
MMKLTSFRIKNFRSIVDTGWQNLSPDNITCLIGQNESGKTSVLEGLKVFYTGIISEDVLRSDLSFPEVSCRFSVPEGWLLKVTENPGTELKELLAGLTYVELTRTWIADLSSIINVRGEISRYLDSLEDAWKLYLEDVTIRLKDEIKKLSDLESSLANLEKTESSIRAMLNVSGQRPGGFSLFRNKDKQSAAASEEFPELKSQLAEIRSKKDKLKEDMAAKQQIRSCCIKWTDLSDKLESTGKHLGEVSHKLEERHQQLTLLMRSVYEDNDREWKGVLNDFRKTRQEKERCTAELERHLAISGYIMEGVSMEMANEKLEEKIHSYKSHYNSEMLGKKYFEYCPVFELFEDFGSLLPNRIDMNDIINANENVEGYKAARNFLTMASLDYSFFQQPSTRILKQKIENLNNSLTQDFQGLWQQSIGRNNKIQIQFELDHYSASYGEKAGKPFLEFWIKDEGERLYPKQRSRGVRWFLSFYMELKAAAILNRQMVLLVDEPGVSLHARAQEDVLKVFEQIKDRIQIIYTTHSPHLVEISKLHRVLAVQRDDVDDYRSATRILDPLSLSSAAPDTLTPLLSVLGKPFSNEEFSSKKLNVVVNDTGSFYLLESIIRLMDYQDKVNIIPSTDISAIPLLCNILMGWGKRYTVLLFGNEKEAEIANQLEKTIYSTDNGSCGIIRMPENFPNSEDLLSTLDFKNHIIRKREGITVTNSQYLREKEVPRNFVLSRFLSDVKAGTIKKSDLDEETLDNFRQVVDKFKS